jgi:large subunit ribosomal protein L10
LKASESYPGLLFGQRLIKVSQGGEICMGRTLENKKEIVAGLKENLSQAQLAVVIDYKGLTVAEMTDLRNRIRPKGGVCKVTKNTFMKMAISGDERWEALSPICKESAAFLLIGEDIGGALKAYQEFQKVSKKSTILGGTMEGKLLSEAQVKAIADLPSKEQLMAQIAGALNAVTAKIAIGVNQVPTGLARALQAVADKEA